MGFTGKPHPVGARIVGMDMYCGCFSVSSIGIITLPLEAQNDSRHIMSPETMAVFHPCNLAIEIRNHQQATTIPKGQSLPLTQLYLISDITRVSYLEFISNSDIGRVYRDALL